jgi:hypothetical protein
MLERIRKLPPVRKLMKNGYGCKFNQNVQDNFYLYVGPQVGLRTGKFRPFGQVYSEEHTLTLPGTLHSIGTAAAFAGQQRLCDDTWGGGLDIPVNKSGNITFRSAEIYYLYLL